MKIVHCTGCVNPHDWLLSSYTATTTEGAAVNMTHSAHDAVAHDLTTGQHVCDTQTRTARGAQLPATNLHSTPIVGVWRVSTSEDGHRARGTQATPAVFGPNFPAAKEAAMPNYVLLWGFNFRRTILYAVPKKLPFGGFNLPRQPLTRRYPRRRRWRGTQLSVSPSA